MKLLDELRARAGLLFLAVAGLADAALSGRVLHMLDASPEFYVNYRLEKPAILAFLVVVGFGIPLALGALAYLCAKRKVTALVSVLLFVVLTALTLSGAARAVPDPSGGWLAPSLSAVLAVALWVGFMKLEVVRIFFAATALSLLLTFYHSATTAGLLAAGSTSKEASAGAPAAAASRAATPLPNVVFIVLDEFPLTTVLDKDGDIDAKRFPNLKALARESYWFRQTSSVSCNTPTAVPAILSGALFGQPAPKAMTPVLQNYPRNLFTELGDSHAIEAWESLTRLCPRGACGDHGGGKLHLKLKKLAEHLGVAWLHASLPVALTPSLPDIDELWMDAAANQDVPDDTAHRKLFPVRVQQFRQLVASIDKSDQPWLRFGHFLLPHAPFENLPDGTPYYKGMTGYALDGKRWDKQTEHVAESHFRHMLQAMFTDRLIGELVARLREVGEYDDTTIVIVADHGVSFVPGDTRRVTNKENYPNLIGVPFFMKLAGQQRGEVVDTPVQTIDVLPTLLGSMKTTFDATAFDGRDILSGHVAPLTTRLHYCSGANYQSFPTELLPALLTQVAARDAKFGARADGSLSMGYASFPDWIGRPLTELGSIENSGRTARLRGLLPERGANAGPTNAPLYLNGTIDGAAPLGSDDLLFVATLNGRVAAVMPAVRFKQLGRIISIMLQPSLLEAGDNTLEFYALDRQDTAPYTFLKLNMLGVVADTATDKFVFKR
ncbi:MAG: sulfatase-like hydrolase/transferase [Gammaproteobacteria bacterium]|nr:sulfatase-like hydrolase/transferase [Gammaproteobacteria bacterium]